MIYSERFYRDFSDSLRWNSYRVRVESTDLFVRTREDYSEEINSIITTVREEIKDHILKQGSFLTTLNPIERQENIPEIIEKMYRASEIASVGPMAAVAGAIAEAVGVFLLDKSDEIIIENGGDIWLNVIEPVVISIFAGESVFSNKIAIKINPEDTPLGICTSSGRVGHSFSFGKADSATVISKNTALADAVATASANIVKSEGDIDAAIEYAMSINEVSGIVIIYNDKLAVKGDIELTYP